MIIPVLELNQKNIPQEILVSESIIPENSEKKIFRKRTKTRQKKGITELKRYRTIPPKKKKYPTKPRKKGDDQIIKINKENEVHIIAGKKDCDVSNIDELRSCTVDLDFDYISQLLYILYL